MGVDVVGPFFMRMWMWLVLLYGLLKGGREIVKKKSLEKSTVLEVLILYTAISFVFVCPTVRNVGGVALRDMGLIAFKSFVIFAAWILSFKAIKQMPISLYGIVDLSRVVFATILSVIILKETPGVFQIIGMVLVCVGLFMSGRMNRKGEEKVKSKILIFTLLSCLFNAISGVMDKYLTRTVTSSQLQFWYMLFLVLYYLIFIIVTKEKIRFANAIKNYWIWILAIMFVIGDRALFIANESQESTAIVMTLIKQSCCIVTLLAGKFIYKEKNIGYKFICAAIIIAGIVLSVL